MSLSNAGRPRLARLWKRVVGLGPAPWVAACVVVASLGGAALYGGVQEPKALPPSSHEQVARLLAEAGTDLQLDSDLDGLPDALENYVYGTDPEHWDTSGNGVPDGWMTRYGVDPLDPAAATRPAGVPPSDALPPLYEGVWPAGYTMTVDEYYRYGRPDNWSEERDGVHWNDLDPTAWDSNGDGIPESWLIHHGLEPLNASTAPRVLSGVGGLSVFEAFENGTSPLAADTDGDGLDDRVEIEGTGLWDGRRISFSRTDPRKYSTTGTAVCDGYLVGRGLDAGDSASSLDDLDNDGATTKEEFNWTRAEFGDAACRGLVGLDPSAFSTGKSGLPDGWLIRYGVDPLDASAVDAVTETAAAIAGEPPVAALELLVKDEYAVNRPDDWDEAERGPWWGGTDPSANDTDGDGLDDVHELQGWTLTVFGQPGSTNATTRHVASDPTRADADGDGLTDLLEREFGTHPAQADTDFDGIFDGDEASLGLDPLRADTAGDLMRDGDRLAFLRLREARVLAGDDYEFLGDPIAPRTYVDVARSQPGGISLPASAPPAAVAALFGPDGDMDADGVSNLLDRDMDNDTLLNGWEARPDTYSASPFGAGPFAAGRSATDPLNPDTDDDDLVDAWEVEFARPRFSLGSFDPDPALWDTDFDGVNDAHEDPDADSIQWVRFSSDGQRTETDHTHSNLREQQFGTDPHRFDTDEDGLSDGWKVFWGLLYPAMGLAPVPPGAVKPQPGLHQADIVTASLNTIRFTKDPGTKATHETGAGSPVAVTDTEGVTHVVFPVSGAYGFTFVAEQTARTNPYLSDTDLDGLPDAWEYYEAAVRLRGAGDARAQCPTALPPSPIVQDSADDQDGDGLTAADEVQAKSDPLCIDTDMGGAEDGQEVLFEAGLSPVDTEDDQFLFDRSRDADGDGIPDFDEITETRTDPTNPDTDGDGLLDGVTLPVDAAETWDLDDPRTVEFLSLGIAYERQTRSDESHGYRFLGEASFSRSPTQPSQRGDRIPDGWVLSHGGFSLDDLPDWVKACYLHGVPPWWDLAAHGPWWGGGDPFEDDCTSLSQRHDTDGDGLDDRIGEDPVPVANHENVYPLGDPRDPELGPDEERRRAQAIVVPRALEPNRVVRVPGGDEPARTTVVLTDLPTETLTVVRGETLTIQGRLITEADDVGVPDATVVVTYGDDVFGAAFTDTSGFFDLPLALVADHSVVLDRPGLVLFSQTQGTVDWQTNPGPVPPGTATFALYSYATPVRADGSAFASAGATLPITVEVEAAITIDAPDIVQVGEQFDVAVETKDKAGVALQDPVEIVWNGKTLGPFTPSPSGIVQVELTAPTTAAGAMTLHASSEPTIAFVSPAAADVDILVRRPAQLQVTDAPTAVDAGDEVPVAGRATTAAGPLAGVPVALTFTGQNGSAGQANTTTDAQGRFAATLPLGSGLRSGDYVLRASLDATDDHIAASDTRSVTVRARPVVLDASAPALQAKGPHVLAVRLLSPQNEPLADKALTMTLGEQSRRATTDDDGDATFTFEDDLPVGPVLQRVVFAGDSGFAPTTASRDRVVQAGTTLVVQHGDATPATSAEVPVQLSDETGKPVRAQPVRVEWSTGASASALTGDDGAAAPTFAVPSDALLGTVIVRAVFEGDPAGTYAPSEATATWRVRTSAHLELPESVVQTGVAVPPGRLVTGTGSPIQDVPVEVQVRDGEARQERTDEDGAFRLVAPPGTISEPGDVRVRVAFAGTDRYEPASATTLLQARAPTNLSVDDVGPLVAGEESVIVVDVQGADGTPIASGGVSVVLQGIEIGGADVSAGTAHVVATVPDAADRGASSLVVRFEGTPTHEPARIEVPVTVVVRSHLTVLVVASQPDEPLAVRIEAGSADGPLAQARLLVRTTQDPAGVVVTTDAQGTARALLVLPDGDSVVSVSYLGGQTAAASTASVVVTPDLREVARGGSTWAIAAAAGAVALLLAALAAYVAVRRRRHPLLDGLRKAERQLAARGPYESDVMLAYATLQDSLVDAGFLPGPSPTPRRLETDLHARVQMGPAPRQALDSLIGLFELARYGRTRLGVEHRDRAHAALRRLRVALMRQGVAVGEVVR